MLDLDATPADDAAFLDLAGRAIVGATLGHGLSDIVAVHIDHWFGERWLGFRGKILGAAGVRDRRLEGRTPPPFHPHRVLSARGYRLTESGRFEYWDDWSSLHAPRPSEKNIHRTLRQNRLYAWYSGDTATTDRAALMVYALGRHGSAAWYAAFTKSPGWQLGRTVAISAPTILSFVERASPGAEFA